MRLDARLWLNSCIGSRKWTGHTAQGKTAVTPQQDRTGTYHRPRVGHPTGTMRQSEPNRFHTTEVLLRPVVGPLGLLALAGEGRRRGSARLDDLTLIRRATVLSLLPRVAWITSITVGSRDRDWAACAGTGQPPAVVEGRHRSLGDREAASYGPHLPPPWQFNAIVRGERRPIRPSPEWERPRAETKVGIES